jgi:hypothetical protein
MPIKLEFTGIGLGGFCLCPKCGENMVREASYHHQLIEKNEMKKGDKKCYRKYR